MRYETTRNIRKNGNSFTLAIPRFVMYRMGLSYRTPVRLAYDPNTDRITIRRLGARADEADIAKMATGMETVEE